MLANFQTRTHIVVLIPYIRSLDVFILQNSAVLDPWTDSTAPSPNHDLYSTVCVFFLLESPLNPLSKSQ